jgi:hypothetical protein
VELLEDLHSRARQGKEELHDAKALLELAQESKDYTLALGISYHATYLLRSNLEIDLNSVPWMWRCTGSQLYCKAAIGLLKRYFRKPGRQNDAHLKALLLETASAMDVSLMDLLLNVSEGDPETKDESGRSLISWASGNGRTATVKLLLTFNRVQPDSKDNDDRSPLWWASRGGHVDAVQILLQKGSILIAPDSNDSDQASKDVSSTGGANAGQPSSNQMGNLKAVALKGIELMQMFSTIKADGGGQNGMGDIGRNESVSMLTDANIAVQQRLTAEASSPTWSEGGGWQTSGSNKNQAGEGAPLPNEEDRKATPSVASADSGTAAGSQATNNLVFQSETEAKAGRSAASMADGGH